MWLNIFFSLWLKSPKYYPEYYAQDSNLAPFCGDLRQREKHSKIKPPLDDGWLVHVMKPHKEIILIVYRCDEWQTTNCKNKY